MRTAIVSDIHGNFAPFEAVLSDVESQKPDRVVFGGDLVFEGPRAAECLDRLRELGWPGVIGNTDRILSDPESAPAALRDFLKPGIARYREELGADRLAWLGNLPMEWRDGDSLAVVHAVPGDLWPAIFEDADAATAQSTFGPLRSAVVVYGHVHRPYVRELAGFVLANSGSVGAPQDRDWRAAYVLIEDGLATVRRVEYDRERELSDLAATGATPGKTLAELTSRPR
jgi:predicted phosphodiesterase